MFKFLSLLGFLVLPGYLVVAQNQIGLLPQVNTDFKLGEDWKVNSKIEGRQLFVQHPIPANKNEFSFERLDFEFVATRSLGYSGSIGTGYLIRRQDGKFIHRFIQQYSITSNSFSSRLVHRFRTDQTLENGEKIQYRLRYRISWEKPLSGLKIDPKEFYLKLNNEYFGILKDRKEDLEIRGLASLGYNKSDKDQIETGLDYRVEEMLSSKPIHKLFLNIGWYHSF